MFLTDNDLEDLIPQRIAHHPDAILEVVVTGNNQESNSIGVPSDDSRVSGERSIAPSSSTSEAVSATRDEVSLRSSKTDDDNRTLVVQSQLYPSERTFRRSSTPNTIQYQLGTEETFVQQGERLQLHSQTLQQQVDEILERIQQTQDQINNIPQNLQKTQENSQQMDEVLLEIRQLDHRAQQFHKQYEQLLQQIRDMDHIVRQKKQSLSEQRYQETLEAFNYISNIQYRVHAALVRVYSQPTVPRLFIILPEPTAAVGDMQKSPCSMQFRLHFLCECGTHTMARDFDKMHKVHLANYPGYDINNQSEFIDKYGSYLLTMMYMVKYGAVAGGLAVPPLLGLNHAIQDSDDQGHLDFIKKNIGRLVNETITHLESTINAANSESNTTTQMDLGPSELSQLKSYVNVTVDERSIGDLRAIPTQKGHSVWICCNHLLEYYEPAFQHLKYIFFASGGVCHDNKVDLKITSETTKKQLYDAIGKVCGIQAVMSGWSLKQLGLDMAGHSSTAESTSEMISSLNDLESLSLDFDQLSMVASGISQGVISDVALTVPRFSKLTLDDFEFIHQCHPVSLKILRASEIMDEARLVDILQHSTSLRELHVGCVGQRFFVLVNSILSTRDKILQSGSQFALRSLEVEGEDLIPLQRTEPCSCYQYLGAVTVSFSEEPHSFDMETHVNLDECHLSSDDIAVCDFIRQYGWSIKNLGASSSFSDRHAELLDQVTQERGSMIEHVDITPDSLTETGLNALHRAIERSKNFHSVRLCLNELQRSDRMQKALLLFERYKGQLRSLRLKGYDQNRQWMARFTQVIIVKDAFPILEALCAENVKNVPQRTNGEIQAYKKFCGTSKDAIGGDGLQPQWLKVMYGY
ncbi:hypothetical protein BGX34_004145 [Mortierella sp. NVP85]|nr:hypothetical protein BGX34_004145 [Mortierella sp. NVP85]